MEFKKRYQLYNNSKTDKDASRKRFIDELIELGFVKEVFLTDDEKRENVIFEINAEQIKKPDSPFDI